MTTKFTEDTLVQQTTADYMRDRLKWDSVYAYNNEEFVVDPHPQPFSQREKAGGGAVCLGCTNDKEVVLKRYLREKLAEFNEGFPDSADDDAVQLLTEYSTSQTLLLTNKEETDLLKDGVPVSFRDSEGEIEKRRLRLFDFDNPENNHFLAVCRMWVKSKLRETIRFTRFKGDHDVPGSPQGAPVFVLTPVFNL